MRHVFWRWWDSDSWPRWMRWIAWAWGVVAFGPLIAVALGMPPLVRSGLDAMDGAVIVLCCVITVGILFPLSPRKRGRTSSLRFEDGFWRFVILPPFLLVGGYSAAVAGLPLAVAMLTGQRTTMVLTVDHVEAGFQRGCGRRIVLSGLMSPFDRMCWAPRNLLFDVDPGMDVVVFGPGTASVVLTTRVDPVGP